MSYEQGIWAAIVLASWLPVPVGIIAERLERRRISGKTA